MRTEAVEIKGMTDFLVGMDGSRRISAAGDSFSPSSGDLLESLIATLFLR